MNKAIWLLAVLMISFVPSAFALEPVLVTEWEIPDTNVAQPGYNNVSANPIHGVALWDDFLFIVTPSRALDGNSFQLVSKVYQKDGTEYTSFYNFYGGMSCGGTDTDGTLTITEPLYIDGTLMFGGVTGCSGGVPSQGSSYQLDVTLPLFINLASSISGRPGTCGTCNPNVPGPSDEYVPIWSNGEAIKFLANNRYFELNATGSWNTEGLVSNYPLSDYFIDDENYFFVQANAYEDFYSYESDDYDGFTTTTLIGSTAPGTGSVIDWNRNPLNPQYLLSSGRVLFVGGSNYDNFQTTSYEMPFTPKYYFEQSNIIGIDNNRWAWVDLSNVSNIVNGTGTEEINADYIWREDLNKIVTYNSTTRVLKIYEVPLPDFFDFAQELINTPPTQDLEFLGVDIADNFIFKNTVGDAQGGFVYQAQQLFPASFDINELEVSKNIEFDQEFEESYADIDGIYGSLDIVTDQPPLKVGTGFGQESLRYTVKTDNALDITIPQPFTADQSDYLATAMTWTYDEEQVGYVGGAELRTSIAYLDGSGRKIIDLFIERFNDNDTAYLYEKDGLSLTFLAELNLTGTDDYFVFQHNFNFSSGEAELIVQTQNDFYTGTLNFTNPLAFGFSSVRFLEDDGDSTFFNYFGAQHIYVDNVGYLYTYNSAQYPEYDLIDDFDEGEFQVFATSLGGNEGFGAYTLYSYVTDKTLGTDNFDYLTTLNFIYNNDTEVLDQQTINQLIKDAEQTLEDEGFNTPNFIAGDLITDTAFGYLDRWNIKSTASKFLVGLLLVLIFIGAGGWVGVMTETPMVGVIGAMFGGIGGLFLVTYWGLFPVWISFTIALITLVVIANMVRNGLTGNGGS